MLPGVVTVNEVAGQQGQSYGRIGDTIAVPQGTFRRTVRLLGLGTRRGPPAEARLLYEEIAAPARLSELNPVLATAADRRRRVLRPDFLITLPELW